MFITSNRSGRTYLYFTITSEVDRGANNYVWSVPQKNLYIYKSYNFFLFLAKTALRPNSSLYGKADWLKGKGRGTCVLLAAVTFTQRQLYPGERLIFEPIGNEKAELRSLWSVNKQEITISPSCPSSDSAVPSRWANLQ